MRKGAIYVSAAGGASDPERRVLHFFKPAAYVVFEGEDFPAGAVSPAYETEGLFRENKFF